MQLKAFNFSGAPTIEAARLSLSSTLRRIRTSKPLGSLDNKDSASRGRDTVRVDWYETGSRYIFILNEARYTERTLQLVPVAALSATQVCNPGTVAREIILHRKELSQPL